MIDKQHKLYLLALGLYETYYIHDEKVDPYWEYSLNAVRLGEINQEVYWANKKE